MSSCVCGGGGGGCSSQIQLKFVLFNNTTRPQCFINHQLLVQALEETHYILPLAVNYVNVTS